MAHFQIGKVLYDTEAPKAKEPKPAEPKPGKIRKPAVPLKADPAEVAAVEALFGMAPRGREE